jgi:hypothetical protein
LNAKVGVIDHETRYNQTLNTIKSIRDKVKDSIIVFVDSSPIPVGDDKIKTIRELCNYSVILFNHSIALEMAERGLKTPGEAYNMIVAIDIIRSSGLQNVQRIFKITGRAELTDDFHIEDYDNMNGKYVFKTRNKSWMSPALELVDTRLWSFDFADMEDVAKMMSNIYNDHFTTGWDMEHLIFKMVPRDKLVEKDVIGLKCQVSYDGRIQYD